MLVPQASGLGSAEYHGAPLAGPPLPSLLCAPAQQRSTHPGGQLLQRLGRQGCGAVLHRRTARPPLPLLGSHLTHDRRQETTYGEPLGTPRKRKAYQAADLRCATFRRRPFLELTRSSS
jgi:hypothetical protein